MLQGEAMNHSDSDEPDRCCCPACQHEVAEDATQCPECGEYFPAMIHRRGASTPPTYNVVRLVVLGAAIVVAILAVGSHVIDLLWSTLSSGKQ